MSAQETKILKDIQLAASGKGWRLFRNNIGHGYTLQGNYIVYGLGVGTSDLIGWRPRLITVDDVGKTIAQFVAVEVKTIKGRASDEQRAFLSAVQSTGGIGVIARCTSDIDAAA